MIPGIDDWADKYNKKVDFYNKMVDIRDKTIGVIGAIVALYSLALLLPFIPLGTGWHTHLVYLGGIGIMTFFVVITVGYNIYNFDNKY